MNGWLVVLASFLVSAAASYPILLLVRKLKSLQVISQHVPESHQKKAGTPNMGGLMVWVAVAVGLAGLAWLRPDQVAWVGGMALLFFGMGAIGFIDDYVVPRMKQGSRGLSWRVKLLMQLFVVVAAGYLIGFREPIMLGLVSLVVLAYCNAYNFSDGLDGLAGSLGLLLCIGVIALAWGSSLAVLCAAMAAGLIVFLAYNRPKASVFMGDTGSLPIGAVLGMGLSQTVVMAGAEARWAYLVAVLMSLVMLAELIPVPLQIFWVKVFKKRLFPFTPIHHAFEKAGMKETRVVLMFVTVQLICIAIGMAVASQYNLVQFSVDKIAQIITS